MTHLGGNNESIRMEGKKPLNGRIQIQGSKNAALPILAACMLIPGKCVLRGCPNITDINYMCSLLESTGASIQRNVTAFGIDIEVDTSNVHEYRLPKQYVSAMRSSVVLMGAMLGRLGEVSVNYPGGCVIGERPIDLHLRGLERLGAQIWTRGNHIHAYADEMEGNVINFPLSSVGATQNAVMAAVTAKGDTLIRNAAREPEVLELCKFLNKAGADIELSAAYQTQGILVIHGTELSRLHEVEFPIISDRIVAGTYMFAAMAAGGNITLENIPVKQLDSVCDVVSGMGAKVVMHEQEKAIQINASDRDQIVNLPYIKTDVYPKFPTDLQSLLIAAACTAKGKLIVKETIFSNRFKIVEELLRMGADITVEQNTAVVQGGRELEGCAVNARELRGGAALVVAGLCASGVTTIANTYFIKRGYQDIAKDLSGVGACMSYVEG